MKFLRLSRYLAVLLISGTGLAQNAVPQTTPAPQQRIQVPESWAMGNLLDVVEPQYLEEAKKRRVGGKVVLNLAIDNEGAVKEADPVQGDPLLLKSAVEAVKKWKFRPYVRDSQRMEVESTATIEFIADTATVRTPKPFRGPLKLRISSGVAEGLVVHKVPFVYPQEAKEKKISGDVVLRAVIDTKGNVADLKVMQGDPVLAESSMEALRKWKYPPYLLNGQPVEVETTVKITFHL
jgi:TonB family protein